MAGTIVQRLDKQNQYLHNMEIICTYCGKKSDKKTGHVNRALKMGNKLYCDKKCSALGRRIGKSEAEKKEHKRLYDIEYRKKNYEKIKIKKHEYFKKDYKNNPDKYREIRRKKQESHNEYCRSPEYKKWKKKYDRKYKAKQSAGEFWESQVLLLEIKEQYNNREVKLENKLIGKSTKRKQKWNRQNSMQKTLKMPFGLLLKK